MKFTAIERLNKKSTQAKLLQQNKEITIAVMDEELDRGHG